MFILIIRNLVFSIDIYLVAGSTSQHHGDECNGACYFLPKSLGIAVYFLAKP